MQTGKSLSLLKQSSDASGALSIVSALAKPPRGNLRSRRSQVECTRETDKRNEKKKIAESENREKERERDESCGILDRFCERNKIKFFLSLAPGSSQCESRPPKSETNGKQNVPSKSRSEIYNGKCRVFAAIPFRHRFVSSQINSARLLLPSDSVEIRQLMGHALLNIARRQHFHFHCVWLRAEDSCAETCDP